MRRQAVGVDGRQGDIILSCGTVGGVPHVRGRAGPGRGRQHTGAWAGERPAEETGYGAGGCGFGPRMGADLK